MRIKTQLGIIDEGNITLGPVVVLMILCNISDKTRRNGVWIDSIRDIDSQEMSYLKALKRDSKFK